MIINFISEICFADVLFYKMKKILSLLAFFVIMQAGFAQVTVAPNATATQMVSTLVGAGVAFSNATLVCPNGASGIFGSGLISLGLDSGIVLSTGKVNNTPFPLSSASSSFNSTDNLAPGDADLITYGVTTASVTNDACALSFDVIPICDTLRFQYVFGSEEYPEFANTQWADAFAFFISGPGIVGVENIALVPASTTPVNINSINAGNYSCPGPTTGCNNCSYYIDNCSGSSFVYDGYTSVLVAEKIVSSCQPYHVKLVVADGTDGIYDTGIFLKKGTLNCFGISIVASATGSSGVDAVESCQNGEFQLCLSNPLATDFTFHFTIGGTATPDVDYPLFPDSVVFLAGQTCVNFSVTPTIDGIAEGPESIMLYYLPSLCASIDSAYINIQDLYTVDAGPDLHICSGDTVQIGTPSYPGTSYFWSPPFDISNPFISDPTFTGINTGLTPISYMLYRSDTINGCYNTDSIYVVVHAQPQPQAGADISICSGAIGQIGTPNYNGITYAWSPITGIVYVDSSQTDVSLTNATNLPVTSDYILHGAVGSCEVFDTVQVTVNPIPNANAGADQTVCSGIAAALGTTISGGYNYLWVPANGLSDPNYYNPQLTPNNPSTSTVMLTYVLNAEMNGCTDKDSVNIYVKPIPFTNAGNDITVCPGETAYIGPTATPGYAYLWSPPDGLLSTNVPTAVVSIANNTTSYQGITYHLTSTLSGCTSSDSVLVTIRNSPIAGIVSDPMDTVCSNNFAVVEYDGLVLNSPTYNWDFGTALGAGTGSGPGPYTLQWNSLGKKMVTLVVEDYGCPSARVEYNFDVIDCTVETTNVFTPDGDGKNDSFIIDMIAYNPNSQLTIYNRWGNVVYHSDNYQNDWRGENTVGGGVYYYTLLLFDGTAFHGMVTVMQ